MGRVGLFGDWQSDGNNCHPAHSTMNFGQDRRGTIRILLRPICDLATNGSDVPNRSEVSTPRKCGRKWSGRGDSNARPQPWQGCALPLSYARSMDGQLTAPEGRGLYSFSDALQGASGRSQGRPRGRRRTVSGSNRGPHGLRNSPPSLAFRLFWTHLRARDRFLRL